MNNRFIVVPLREARKYDPLYYYNSEDFGWCIIDTKNNEVVGMDGGEPEDQILVRNWKWVPALLNKIDEENKDITNAAKDVINYIAKNKVSYDMGLGALLLKLNACINKNNNIRLSQEK